MLLTNKCTWLEEPYDRRCYVHCGIRTYVSHSGTYFNSCTEQEKLIDINIHMENVSLWINIQVTKFQTAIAVQKYSYKGDYGSIISIVFPRIEAQASISFWVLSTRPLNEACLFTGPASI